MKLIHMQTTIQTVFGVVDDDGNAIPQQPITAQVSRFNADAFAEGYEAIAEARDQALANAEETAPNRIPALTPFIAATKGSRMTDPIKAPIDKIKADEAFTTFLTSSSL